MPAKPKAHHAEGIVDFIIGRAPALIAAGVSALTVDGFSVQLHSSAPAAPGDFVEPPPAASHIDPLQDPATFPNGRVPGFARPQPE